MDGRGFFYTVVSGSEGQRSMQPPWLRNNNHLEKVPARLVSDWAAGLCSSSKAPCVTEAITLEC